MTFTKLLSLIVLATSLLFFTAFDPGDAHLPIGTPATTILASGEEYVYEVSWSVFKLGTVRLKTFPDLRAEAYVDSYDGVPFVDLHAIQYCVMDTLLYCRVSRSLEKKKEQWWELDYLSNDQDGNLVVEECYRNDPTSMPTSKHPRDTVKLPDRHFIDGLSIGLFPRRFVHTSQTVAVPTILNGKLGTTTYYFNGIAGEEEISALDLPVRVVKVDATTDLEGLFGMSGDFAGWFSDDSLAVPIKGKVKVLLGNVNLELIKWNRPGWKPPTK